MLLSITLSILVLSVAGLFAVCTAVFAWRYGQPWTQPPQPKHPATNKLPSVAVLVGLRGSDPFLLPSLKSLLTQDYPDFQVHFVVDQREDPAWAVVEQAIRETNSKHVSIEEFLDIPAHGIVNCTNSKIVQGARTVGDSADVFVMMDGDAEPHSTWLRDLVSPLALDPGLGATYGNRWFTPPKGDWGSIVRFIWNAGSVPPMDFLKMPWGGCFAIRSTAIQQGSLLDVWARQVALDAGTASAFRKLGLGLQFVPQMMVFNREECDLKFATNFIRRQLTWTTLYHRLGWLGWAEPLFVTALLLACLVLGTIQWGTASTWTFPLPWIAVIALWFISVVCLLVLDWTVRRAVAYRGQSKRWISASDVCKIILGVPLAFATTSWAALEVVFSKRVQWRGLTLEIESPTSIRVIKEVAPRTTTPTGDTPI